MSSSLASVTNIISIMALRRFQICDSLREYVKDHKKRKFIKAGVKKWLKNQLSRYLRYRNKDLSQNISKRVYKGYDL